MPPQVMVTEKSLPPKAAPAVLGSNRGSTGLPCVSPEESPLSFPCLHAGKMWVPHWVPSAALPSPASPIAPGTKTRLRHAGAGVAVAERRLGSALPCGMSPQRCEEHSLLCVSTRSICAAVGTPKPQRWEAHGLSPGGTRGARAGWGGRGPQASVRGDRWKASVM